MWATQRLIDTCTALTPEQLMTPVPGAFGSILAALRSAMTRNGAAWTKLRAGAIDPDADVVEREDGWELHSPLGVRLAQVIHHGTDHRSQVCTALTRLGLTPPALDVRAFAHATGRERVVPAPNPATAAGRS